MHIKSNFLLIVLILMSFVSMSFANQNLDQKHMTSPKQISHSQSFLSLIQDKLNTVRNKIVPKLDDSQEKPILDPRNVMALSSTSHLKPNPEFKIQEQWPGPTKTQISPPDPSIAVGDESVIVVTNDQCQIKTINGASIFSTTLYSIFGSSSFDPKVLYIPSIQRYILMSDQGNSNSNSRIHIAISKNSRPTDFSSTSWSRHEINVGEGSFWADYPGFSFDESNVYITNNLFSSSNGNQFVKGRLWAIPIQSLISGYVSPYIFDLSCNGAYYPNIKPAKTQFDSDRTHYFVAVKSSTEQCIYRLINSHSLSAASIRSNAVTVSSVIQPPGFVQQRNGHPLDSGDNRIQSAVRKGNFLYYVRSVSASSLAAIGWYRYDIQTLELSDSGIIVVPSTHLIFPSISINSDNIIVINCAATSSSMYPSIWTFYSKNDHAFDGPFEIRQGSSQLSEGHNRFGDYSGITLDPTGAKFWLVHEIAAFPMNKWNTYIASLNFDIKEPTETNPSSKASTGLLDSSFGILIFGVSGFLGVLIIVFFIVRRRKSRRQLDLTDVKPESDDIFADPEESFSPSSSSNGKRVSSSVGKPGMGPLQKVKQPASKFVAKMTPKIGHKRGTQLLSQNTGSEMGSFTPESEQTMGIN